MSRLGEPSFGLSPDPDFDIVSAAAVRIALLGQHSAVTGIVCEGTRVRLYRQGTVPVTVDMGELEELLAQQVPGNEADVAWKEVLYDLGAHDQPLRDLGLLLHYVSIARDGDALSVVLSDGDARATYTGRLSELAGYVGLPDDLATAFIERDVEMLAFQ